VLPEIAFVGRSNVGKSSLINALTGRRALARTSKTPGKTRTCNVYNVAGRYYLVDLPGYGYARVSRGERAAFARLLGEYLTARSALVGVVWLMDARRTPTPEDVAVGERLAAQRLPVLVAVTKADKLRTGERRARLSAILDQLALPEDQGLFTSSTTREGIDDLRSAVVALADSGA
jgi:GTP-binding protein